MQVAHREGETGCYLTVKDNQVVTLHPSSGLKANPEWVVFNEFIFTAKPYIRTVSEVRPEWYVPSCLPSCGTSLITMCRLLELAPSYFDLSSFPDGETKRRLQSVMNEVQQSRRSDANGEASSHTSSSTTLFTLDDVVAMLTQMSTSTPASTLEDAIERLKEMSTR